MTAKICLHCSRNVANRARGLCWSCYYTPGVIDLYPSTSKYARRGVVDGSTKEPIPTTALPATEAKVRVLEERAKRGESLFHKADARHKD